MFLIGIRARPSSTVSCTGMSRIMLMSLPAIAPGVGWKLVNDAGETCSAGPCSSVAVSLRASTAAQSAAFGSAAAPGTAAEGSVAMGSPLLDDEAREVHVLHGVAHRALLGLLRLRRRLVLARLLGAARGGGHGLGGEDLDAHR